jgi:hypothetical protein
MHRVRWRLVQSSVSSQRYIDEGELEVHAPRPAPPRRGTRKQLERWALLLDGDDDGNFRPRQRGAPVDCGEVAARNKKRGR